MPANGFCLEEISTNIANILVNSTVLCLDMLNSDGFDIEELSTNVASM